LTIRVTDRSIFEFIDQKQYNRYQNTEQNACHNWEIEFKVWLLDHDVSRELAKWKLVVELKQKSGNNKYDPGDY
jgi:hypothetical protein